MKKNSKSPADSTARTAGKRIPEQRRDCGPQVDTWPIMDTQVGDAPKPQTDEYGRPKERRES
jgi:hypothetical protein